MYVKRAERGAVVISHTLATRPSNCMAVYRQGIESSVRTSTDIFGDRSVSLTIRSELEIRSPSVSASETTEHEANSLFRAKKH